MSRGRFHLTLGISLVVGAILLLAAPHDPASALAAIVLVPVCLALYALLHAKATSARPGSHGPP